MQTKELQGKLWSTAPELWSVYFEPFFLPLYKKALEQLQLNEDLLLLDDGCGSGMFASMAISTGANVTGIDAAPGLLEIARKRNPDNNFLEEEIEALPFADNSFDVVSGFNSFQFAGDVNNAFAEAKRVLKPGGRLVIGIWDKQEKSDVPNVLKAIGTLLPPLPANAPGPFALSEDGAIEKIMQELDMKMVYQTTVSGPFIYYSLQDGISSFMGTGPAAAACNRVMKEEVQRVIAKALQPYYITDDMYHLQNSFLLFIAEKI